MNFITMSHFSSGIIFDRHGWFFAIPGGIQTSSELVLPVARTESSLLGDLRLWVPVVGGDGSQCGTDWMWEVRAQQRKMKEEPGWFAAAAISL